MSDRYINGIHFIDSSSGGITKFTIEKQIVNSRKIPDLTINVKNTSILIDVDTALRLVAENLTTESQYLSSNGLQLTHTGQFYAKAYDSNQSGSINFTDIGVYPNIFGGGYQDVDPNVLGNFGYKNTVLGIGDEFVYNIDVPLFTSDLTQKSMILDSLTAGGSYPLSLINSARDNLISNQFTFLSAHELGGHGMNPGIGHKQVQTRS